MANQEAKFIERIEIKGLWNRYDVDWQLNPDVNILVGENGTGKSTIIQLIKTLDILLKENQKLFSYETGFENFFGSVRIECPNDIYVEIFVKKNGKLLELKNKPGITFILYFIQTFDVNLYEKNDYDKKNKPYIKTHLDKELDEIIDGYVEYQLNQNKKIRNNDKSYDVVFEKQRFLIETLNRLFVPTEKRVDEEENRISFLLNDNTKISPYDLSSGEKQLLIILLTVLCQDEKPSVLLLDEPEISLHVSWQYELIKIIRTLNPNCQLIIVTHSTSIFTKGWMDKIFFMTGKEGILHPIAEKV